jgi:hypothetical protein
MPLAIAARGVHAAVADTGEAMRVVAEGQAALGAAAQLKRQLDLAAGVAFRAGQK